MLAVTPTNQVICTVPIAIGRTRITRMKILRPHQLDEQIIHVDSKGIEPFQKHCNCSSLSVGHDCPFCIGDPDIHRGSLPAPGGRSGQSEYSYNLAALLLPFSYLGLMVIHFWKSFPAASHRESLLPPPAHDLFLLFVNSYCCFSQTR